MAQFLYGKNVVKQLLEDAREVQKIFLAGNDVQIESLAKKRHVEIVRCDKKKLHGLTKSDNHQGVVAQIEDYKTYSIDELIQNVPEGENGLFVLLDELEDPHNLGAILRTADASGVHGVIFKKTNAVGLTPTVAKVSAGAIDTVKCASVTNLVRCIEDLKKKGYWIVGTDMNGSDYRSIDYNMPTVIVIGNEGKGISRLLKEKCDFIVSIPMVGKISSLNASVSAGILLYEVYNKRFPL